MNELKIGDAVRIKDNASNTDIYACSTMHEFDGKGGVVIAIKSDRNVYIKIKGFHECFRFYQEKSLEFVSRSALKKSELLKLTLADFDNWKKDGTHHMCNRIDTTSRKYSYNGNTCATYTELTKWIATHLKGRMTLDIWVHDEHCESRPYSFKSEEMMAYRRLWLIDMIAYWESKGQ